MKAFTTPSARWLSLATWLWLAASVVVTGYLLPSPRWDFRNSAAADVRLPGDQLASHSAPARFVPHATRNIEEIRVGDRVLAVNPEVTDAERNGWQEPVWTEWMKVSLVMPKPDGTELAIELLRPESWLIAQTRFIVEAPYLVYAGTPANSQEEPQDDSPAPLRPVHRHFQSQLAQIAELDLRLAGLTVEMDLPELGLTGHALIVDVQPSPEVNAGAGSVVTATFHHSSGDVIDLVIAGEIAGDSETLGTTSNHPFWSVDRAEYVQAGHLEPGEQVLTYAGETKRVASKLARPGWEPVYNMEVFGEHVYFVGEDGILVHNSKSYVEIAEGHSGGHLGRHLDSAGNRVARTSRSGLAGDHVLPKQAIADAMAAAGVSKTTPIGKSIIAIQDSARNLRLMDFNVNSSKGMRNAVEWMGTAIGSQMPRRFIQNILRKQFKNAQEINVILNKAAGTKNVDYFAKFFNR